jgi:Alpha/beta hydrolase domain
MQHRALFRGLWFWIPVILAILWLGRCARAAEAELVATPRATAVPVSATNQPFLAAARAEQPVSLDAAGYAESEFVVSGVANVYDWTTNGRATELSVHATEVPYATRMLLRRPTDPRKFSGFVFVELLDAGDLYDRAPLWGLSWQQFLRRGDAWVGLTVTPAAIAALRRFDSVRYAGLTFAHQQAADCHPAATDLRANPPDTESGLAWDAIAQVGALLRSGSKENPLLDLNPRHVIAAGYGEAGAYIVTYANALHAALRLGDGAPIYDGYLSAAGAQLAVPINHCVPALPEQDPRRGALPRDVPFVTVMTESDFNLAPSLRRADSDAPEDVFRLYEIPGAAHTGPYPAGMPVAADLQIAGFAPPATDLCTDAPGDFPGGLAFNAIWEQYAQFLGGGRSMVSLSRIETLPDGGPRHDEMGNASGGWRLPQLEVPLAVYAGHSTPRDTSERAAAVCALTGSRQPFAAARLKSLYHDRAQYLKRLRAAVDLAVQERRLVGGDGTTLSNQPVQDLPAF